MFNGCPPALKRNCAQIEQCCSGAGWRRKRGTNVKFSLACNAGIEKRSKNISRNFDQCKQVIETSGYVLDMNANSWTWTSSLENRKGRLILNSSLLDSQMICGKEGVISYLNSWPIVMKNLNCSWLDSITSTRSSEVIHIPRAHNDELFGTSRPILSFKKTGASPANS